MYYNTTNESGAVLEERQDKAKTQRDIIKELFIKHQSLSPSQICTRNMVKGQPPITSIRRAITDLTNEGVLIKTNLKMTGMYGASEYLWKINNGQLELSL